MTRTITDFDKSLEELKAQEEAVEREFGVRFSRAIEKTRNSINDRLDTIFEGDIAEANGWLRRHGRGLYSSFG